MWEFLKRVGHIGHRVFGGVSQAVRKFGETASPVVRSVANFVGNHHHHIAPLAHGLAVASGHEGLQKATGLGLALSNIASMHQKRRNVNDSSVGTQT